MSDVGDPGTDTVRIGVDGRVGIITFARPERRNALHPDMYEPMIAAIGRFAADPEIGAVVVTGEGSAFCAGGDVRGGRNASGERPAGPPSAQEATEALMQIARLSQVIHEADVVTIAAVNGPAVGAGMSIALACDLRVAARSASFTGGWSRLGFSGDFGGTWFLARLVGPSRALRFLVSNATMNADQALALGVVDEVVDDADFARAWRAAADVFALGPQPAVPFMKRNVREALKLPFAEYLPREARRMVESGRSADHREAVRAWLDKRDPVFGARRDES